MSNGSTLAVLLGGTYALAALVASAMLGVHACTTSVWHGVGVRAHALGFLVFAVSLVGAAMLASILATVTLLLLGAAM